IIIIAYCQALCEHLQIMDRSRVRPVLIPGLFLPIFLQEYAFRRIIMIYGRNTRGQFYREQETSDFNKVSVKNAIRIFILLFAIMVVFTAFAHNVHAYDPKFVAFPLSPDMDTKIKLQWESVPGAVKYKIYRNDGGEAGFVLIDEIDTQYTLDPLSYTDQGLEPETFYMYRLEAYDEDMDNLLTSDKIASARTTPLIRPYGLKAVFDVNSRYVTLTWNSSALATGSYITMVEKGTPNEWYTTEISSTRVLMPGSNSVTFTVRTVTAGY